MPRAQKLPKFSVIDVSDPPAAAEPGDTFEVTGTVENSGRKAGRATVRVSLRQDNTPESGPNVIGMTRTDRVAVDEFGDFVLDATVPADLADGSYFMVACATPARKSGCLVAAGQVVVAEPVNFTPGSRSLGDELFPQIGNGGYDAASYEINLNYDPADNEFLAGTSTTMNAVSTQDLSEFTMDFQDIPVSSVSVNGVPADSFSQVDAEPEFAEGATQPMKLVIDPAGPGIIEGSAMAVDVAYEGTPVLVTDADESFEGWIPSNNFPTDKATFDTNITVPMDLEAVGIGELVSNGANGDGTETWSWSEDDPTSTYLTTATNGNFDYTKRDITESLTGRVLPQFEFIDSSATPTEKATINTNLGRTEAMTNFLSARFGPYPYDSGGAVADKAAGVGYALEVATKSHYAGNFTTGAPGVSQSTLVHEISHQWMGNAVTLERWNDIWFQEGWAQWSSWSWNFEDGTSTKSPGEQWSENYASGPATKWDTIPTELNNDPADLFAFFPTYTRGAMTFQGYREIVGSPKFFEFARELQTRFAYGNVSSEDVVDLMIEISDFTGDDLALLEDYFDQWLYQAGKPTITPNDFT